MASDSAHRLAQTLLEALKTIHYGIDDLRESFDSQYGHLMKLQKDYDYMKQNIIIATDLIRNDTPLKEQKLRNLERTVRNELSSKDKRNSKMKTENIEQNQINPLEGLSKMNNHSDKMFNHSCNKDRFFENMYKSVNLEFENDYYEANAFYRENVEKSKNKSSSKDETLRESEYEDKRKRKRSISSSRKGRPRTTPEILNTFKWNEGEKVRLRIENERNFDRKYKKLCTPPINNFDDKYNKYPKNDNNLRRTQSSKRKIEPSSNFDRRRKSQFSEYKALSSESNDKNFSTAYSPNSNYSSKTSYNSSLKDDVNRCKNLKLQKSEKLSTYNPINSLNDSDLMYQDHFNEYVNGLCSENLKNEEKSECVIDHATNKKNESSKTKNIDNHANALKKQYEASEPKKCEHSKLEKHCDISESKKVDNLILLPEKNSALEINQTNETSVFQQSCISKEENQIQLKNDDKMKEKSPRLYQKSKLKVKKSSKKHNDESHINTQSTVKSKPVNNKKSDHLADYKVNNLEEDSSYVALQVKIEQKLNLNKTDPNVTRNVNKDIAETVNNTISDNKNTFEDILKATHETPTELIQTKLENTDVYESKIIPEQLELHNKICDNVVSKCASIDTELKNPDNETQNSDTPKQINDSSTFPQNIEIEQILSDIDMTEKLPSNTNLLNDEEQNTSYPEENSDINCESSKNTTDIKCGLSDSDIGNTGESMSSSVLAEHVKSVPKTNKSKVITKIIDENTISVTLHRRRTRIIKG